MTFDRGVEPNHSDVSETGNDYVAIVKEAQELLAIEPELLKQACPKCGEILQVNSEGVRNCPMGHYRSTDYE